MNNPITTYEEFSEALRKVSEKIDELSGTLDEFAENICAFWNSIFPATYETLGELAIVYEKIRRDKPPRPSHGVYFKGKEYNYGTYRYIKDFQRNLPYQRRRY